MLVAYGPDGCVVTAEETPPEQLLHWSREHVLRCPNCKGTVFVRGGPEKRMQLHFAHQKGECAWSTEGESVRHMRGKIVLAAWLREQFPQAHITLEERLPEPERIADIFVRHADGACQAIEFQCAPLDLEAWQQRHAAYRAANIIDTWIIGSNRSEKQEAFIEAILARDHEVLFLDPLTIPRRAWLRWPVTREVARDWQREYALRPSFEGWVGRLGVGVSLLDNLSAFRLNREGALWHVTREALQMRRRLSQHMARSGTIQEKDVCEYLQVSIGEAALRDVIIPLTHAYIRDPDLLRRYNYGRGQEARAPSQADVQRVERARQWLAGLAQQGYGAQKLRGLACEIPMVGPYAALAAYLEMLIGLASS